MAILSGKDPARFGCHSLRRGGATFAADSGVPPYFIKLQGDWASDCYTRYIAFFFFRRRAFAQFINITGTGKPLAIRKYFSEGKPSGNWEVGM